MKITLICAGCGKSFEKEKNEYDRQLRLHSSKYDFYCNQSCASKHNRLDGLSAFREILANSKKSSRVKKLQIDITLSYLKNLWDNQKGNCSYLGIPMHLSKRGECKPNSASLDRIDSSKGYVQGNVEFVCLFVNYGKNKFSKEDTLNFLKELR
jgi:ribosomal protein L33